jgi:hypothetical protein
MNGRRTSFLLPLLIITLLIIATKPVKGQITVNEEIDYYYFTYEKGVGWSDGTLWSPPTSNFAYNPIIRSSDLEEGAHVIWVDVIKDEFGSVDTATLRLGHFNGNDWDVYPVPSNIRNVWKTAFHVDKEGVDYLFYPGWDGNDVMYSRFNGSSWTDPISLIPSFGYITDSQLLDDGTMYFLSNTQVAIDYNIWIGNKTSTIFQHKDPSYDYLRHKIIAHGNTTVDLFRSAHNYNTTIFHQRSMNNGLNWSEPYEVFNLTMLNSPIYTRNLMITKGTNKDLFVMCEFFIIDGWNTEDFLCYSYFDGDNWSPQKVSLLTEYNSTRALVISEDESLHRIWQGTHGTLNHDILSITGDLVQRQEIIKLKNAKGEEAWFDQANVVVTDSGDLQLIIEASFYVEVGYSNPIPSFEFLAIIGLAFCFVYRKKRGVIGR